MPACAFGYFLHLGPGFYVSVIKDNGACDGYVQRYAGRNLDYVIASAEDVLRQTSVFCSKQVYGPFGMLVGGDRDAARVKFYPYQACAFRECAEKILECLELEHRNVSPAFASV